MSFAALAIMALGAIAACGDGPDETATPTTAATSATGTPSATQSGDNGTDAWPGQAPTFGKNITGVTPANGDSVTQAETAFANLGNPGNLCVQANFADMPANEGPLWYRMVVDDAEVTAQLTWIVRTQDNPTEGRVCYAPDEGIEPGRHEVSVAVQNPNNVNEPTRELVSWRFEVE
jgi:hypothetical protein